MTLLLFLTHTPRNRDLAFATGLKRDVKKAAYYFKLSADKGDAEAQYCYGQRLKKGQGVGKDVAAAVRYFELAAEQGPSKPTPPSPE